MSSPIPHSLSVFRCDPAPITEFDDSDLLEESAGAVASVVSPKLQLKDQDVPIIKQSVLIGSLLEHLCSLYENDKVKSQKLYYILCDQLAKLGIISPVAYLKEFTSVHTQYRQTLYNIIQASIMRIDSKPAFPSHQDIPASLIGADQGLNMKPVIVDPDKVFHFDTSRYHQEFDEKGRVGRGGYGSVFHAQSKIDGQDYAIKKITLRESPIDKTNETLLREVHILAGLRHKNIVRYHNAWIEHVNDKTGKDVGHGEKEEFSVNSDGFPSYSNKGPPHADSFLLESSMEESHLLSDLESRHVDVSGKNGINSGDNKRSPSKFWGDDSTSETSVSGPREKSRKIKFSISPQASDAESDLIFQHSNSGISHEGSIPPESPPKETILTHGVRRDMDMMHRVQSFIISKDTDPARYGECVKAARNRSFSTVEDHHLSDKKELLHVLAKESKFFSKDVSVRTKLVLYIQMELCQTSLKHWLSVRNKNISTGKEKLCKGTSLTIMKQIASALLFIHSKDLIHRDVKPPNIFLNGLEQPHILLGDFGLAKSDFDTPKSNDEYGYREGLRRLDSHTSGVGTTTYAAPEQLTEEIYDSKVDMYSFGIVIYELWNPFGTAMERAQHVKQLRKNVIPGEFTLKHPQIGKLVSSLLHHDPKLRPSADEIFQGGFFERSKDKIIKDQSKKILALEKENRELKLLNKKLQRLLNSKLPPA